MNPVLGRACACTCNLYGAVPYIPSVTPWRLGIDIHIVRRARRAVTCLMRDHWTVIINLSL